MLPRRPGARFALEALFLVLLALAAGLADLRPLIIVIVMAGAWALVALAELSAERIDRSPISYLQPAPPEEEEEPQEVFGPRPEERTVVAPPEEVEEAREAPTAPGEEPAEDESAAEPEAEPEPEPEPVPEPAPVVPAPPPEPAGWSEEPAEAPMDAAEEEQPPPARRRRRFLRRREPEVEAEPASPPRHVKLLPRRAAAEPSPASQEVAELFGSTPEEDEPAQSEENRG